MIFIATLLCNLITKELSLANTQLTLDTICIALPQYVQPYHATCTIVVLPGG